jgi:hypothetical protein
MTRNTFSVVEIDYVILILFLTCKSIHLNLYPIPTRPLPQPLNTSSKDNLTVSKRNKSLEGKHLPPQRIHLNITVFVSIKPTVMILVLTLIFVVQEIWSGNAFWVMEIWLFRVISTVTET